MILLSMILSINTEAGRKMWQNDLQQNDSGEGN